MAACSVPQQGLVLLKVVAHGAACVLGSSRQPGPAEQEGGEKRNRNCSLGPNHHKTERRSEILDEKDGF